MEWRHIPLFCFNSFLSSSMLRLVVLGASPDDPVQVEGDSSGVIAGCSAGTGCVSSGSLVTSALLAKPMKALDGTAMDPDDACEGSSDGALVGSTVGVT